MHTLIAPAINLGALIIFLAIKLREPTRQFVHQRHVSLRDELESVRSQLRGAREKYDEFTAKLKAIDVEISGLHDQMRQDAQSMKLRVLSDAQRVSASIVSDARAAADGLVSELKARLAVELGGHVLERAEAILRERLTGDDRARLRQEFSMQLERAQ